MQLTNQERGRSSQSEEMVGFHRKRPPFWMKQKKWWWCSGYRTSWQCRPTWCNLMQLLLDVNCSNLMTLHVLSESRADSYNVNQSEVTRMYRSRKRRTGRTLCSWRPATSAAKKRRTASPSSGCGSSPDASHSFSSARTSSSSVAPLSDSSSSSFFSSSSSSTSILTSSSSTATATAAAAAGCKSRSHHSLENTAIIKERLLRGAMAED